MRRGQLRLKSDTLAITSSGGKPTAVTVPKTAVCYVTGLQKPDDPRMIEVAWQDRRVFMFEVDLQNRGERINGAGGD